MTPVIIDWVDIVSELVWNSKETPRKLPRFKTVGFLLDVKEDSVWICDTEKEIGNRCGFPLGCIKEIVDGKGQVLFTEQQGSLQKLQLRLKQEKAAGKTFKGTAKQPANKRCSRKYSLPPTETEVQAVDP
jgi:hypothetical protein